MVDNPYLTMLTFQFNCQRYEEKVMELLSNNYVLQEIDVNGLDASWIVERNIMSKVEKRFKSVKSAGPSGGEPPKKKQKLNS